jgi:hypothetical protein
MVKHNAKANNDNNLNPEYITIAKHDDNVGTKQTKVY